MPSQDLLSLAAAERRGFTLDSDVVARAITIAVRRYASLVEPNDREDVVQDVVIRMHGKWRTGEATLDRIHDVIPKAVRDRRIDYHRSERRRARLTLNAPTAEGTETGELLPAAGAQPDQLVAQREQLAQFPALMQTLEDHLATRPPLVRAVEGLARQGVPRADIAGILTARGMPVSSANVRQIISRLNKALPELSQLWANRAANGEAAKKPSSTVATRERRNDLALAVDAAGPLVGAIAAYRRSTHEPDWVLAAAAANVGSVEAREAWAEFIGGLSPELRLVAP
jgi:DNA-directed RNA polymerase specialized sigma24 family protein